jgi:DNA-binding response OmpR family regulator
MKVLIVEAEQWLADWVSGLLPEAKISHARNGLLALRELTDCPNIPELIILNADLPDIGGDLLLNTIHADPRTASMPAICLCDSQAQCDRMQVAGAYAVLSIPLGLFALRYTVKTLLTEKSNIRNSFEGAVV